MRRVRAMSQLEFERVLRSPDGHARSQIAAVTVHAGMDSSHRRSGGRQARKKIRASVIITRLWHGLKDQLLREPDKFILRSWSHQQDWTIMCTHLRLTSLSNATEWLVHWQVSDWAAALQQTDLVIGPRAHGTILGTMSGVPSLGIVRNAPPGPLIPCGRCLVIAIHADHWPMLTNGTTRANRCQARSA